MCFSFQLRSLKIESSFFLNQLSIIFNVEESQNPEAQVIKESQHLVILCSHEESIPRWGLSVAQTRGSQLV